MKLPNPNLITRYLGDDTERLYWSRYDSIFNSHHGEFPTLGVIIIPSRELSDGYSIPKILRGLISKSPRHINAGRLHDHLYKSNAIPKLSRKQADKIFRLYMKKYGVGIIKRNVIYQGVRVGGWASWNKQEIQYAS